MPKKPGPGAMMMLIDTSICMACRGCQVACKDWHQLPAETTEFTGTYQNPPDMSADTLTVVKFTEAGGIRDYKYMEWLFFKDQCRHCKNAACQDACPVRFAIATEAGGAIVITDRCDPNHPRCNGQCVDACPYNIPKINGGKAKKCDFCFDRIEDGKSPMCAKTCPPGAITFGNSAYVMGTADDRLAEIQGEYSDANIYPNGSQTRVIWLLVDDPGEYGI
jgi:formate dehydrogenase iron-sulfur subunit